MSDDSRLDVQVTLGIPRMDFDSVFVGSSAFRSTLGIVVSLHNSHSRPGCSSRRCGPSLVRFDGNGLIEQCETIYDQPYLQSL